MAAQGVLSNAGNYALSLPTNRSIEEWRNNGTEICRTRLESRPVFRASSSGQHQLSSSNCQRTIPLQARHGDWRRTGGGTIRPRKFGSLAPHASVAEEQQDLSVQTSSPSRKDFLEDLKPLGRVRLIVNTGVAVLESVTSFEKLYYHAGPRGEYANIMSRDDNVDFHLLLEKVSLVRLVKGKSMKGDIPTYMVRLVDVNDSVAVSVLVMWKLGTDGDYDPGQVEAFQAILEKYGEEFNFSAP